MADSAPEVAGDPTPSTVIQVVPSDAIAVDAVNPVMSKEPSAAAGSEDTAAPVPSEPRDDTASVTPGPSAAEASSLPPQTDDSPTQALVTEAPKQDAFWDDNYHYITPAGFIADARRNFWTVRLSRKSG